MTADSWKSFATDGPPHVGQDVIVWDSKGMVERYGPWTITSMAIRWTHWQPFIPPAKEDGLVKWWKDFKAKAPPDVFNRCIACGVSDIVEEAWNEATRQANEKQGAGQNKIPHRSD